MTTVQVRTDERIKKNAQKVLKKLGLDLSTAINIYLMQIVVHGGIPFRVLTENGMTPKEERAILKGIAWAKKNGKSYSSARELHEDIMRD